MMTAATTTAKRKLVIPRRWVTDRVIEDLKGTVVERRLAGDPLTTQNGRDALQDAYESALTLVQYLKQCLMEWDDADR